MTSIIENSVSHKKGKTKKEYRIHKRVFADMLSHLLSLRGIEPDATAAREAFLSPDYDAHTHSPTLMKDMARSVERIFAAIDTGEKIAIYSDYDADGIPGAVVLADFFKKIEYKNFINYIPHRHHEGFGLNAAAMEKLADDGVKLIITIDCGIADVEPVAVAVRRGVDVIVTDHHMPGPILPPAYAILNPKQPGCQYPEKMLCGAAVVWKLVVALAAHARVKWPQVSDSSGEKSGRGDIKEGWEKWLLDMVGIATLSDMVPLVGENRVLAYYGLLVLRKSPRIGLKQLLSVIGVYQHRISEDDIGFSISPRINAASRMGHPMDAFDVLSADDPVRAAERAEHLDSINNERKGIVAGMVRQIHNRVRERWPDLAEMPVTLVLGHSEWRPSLLGLAANTCAEEYGRPVFLWGRDGEELIRGSCRSGGHASVHAIMHAVDAATPGTFVQFGGHEHSGGFACTADNAVFLEERLCRAMEEIGKSKAAAAAGVGASDTGLDTAKQIDAELTPAEFNWKLYDAVAPLAPFGVGNPKPLFMIRGAKILAIRTFGRDDAHLEIAFDAPSMQGGVAKAIAFFKGKDMGRNFFSAGEALVAGARLNIVGTLEKSFFKMRPELRVRLEDVVDC